ncbi:MAG: alpha-E domain-containing protein [Hyphomicrobiales bacterium]|nr:alpha-E domain-containing protein [Hyphomicrobiales bacterium]
MTSNLLSRHAECYFWLARYLERAESLARILEAQTSFQRSGNPNNSWAWIVALYSDQENFAKKFSEPTAQNVINYYVTWLDNPSSIQSCVRAARENARALRPLISSDVWMQINDFYSRVIGLTESDFSENRLSRSCDSIKRGCYAQIGVAESTLYRDEGWPFFRLGLFIERADQTSRLLDVQFAKSATGNLNDLTMEEHARLWNVLLRSASAYHAFRRVHPRGFNPADIAHFLVFDRRLPRSLSFCAAAIQRMVNQLRTEFRLRNAQRALEHVDKFQADLQDKAKNGDLIEQLHDTNDWVQRELIDLSAELGVAFFGAEIEELEAAAPAREEPDESTARLSRSQGQSQIQSQMRS